MSFSWKISSILRNEKNNFCATNVDFSFFLFFCIFPNRAISAIKGLWIRADIVSTHTKLWKEDFESNMWLKFEKKKIENSWAQMRSSYSNQLHSGEGYFKDCSKYLEKIGIFSTYNLIIFNLLIKLISYYIIYIMNCVSVYT